VDSIDDGIQIDDSDRHIKKAELSTNESSEPHSNMTLERARHSLKHWRPIVLTDAGIEIDESDEQYANAKSSIIESFEPDSNVTAERDLHCQKQNLLRLSTDDGIQIDNNELPKKAQT
jgi:hypothetical protein